jgi:hypothetical protein
MAGIKKTQETNTERSSKPAEATLLRLALETRIEIIDSAYRFGGLSFGDILNLRLVSKGMKEAIDNHLYFPEMYAMAEPIKGAEAFKGKLGPIAERFKEYVVLPQFAAQLSSLKDQPTATMAMYEVLAREAVASTQANPTRFPRVEAVTYGIDGCGIPFLLLATMANHLWFTDSRIRPNLCHSVVDLALNSKLFVRTYDGEGGRISGRLVSWEDHLHLQGQYHLGDLLGSEILIGKAHEMAANSLWSIEAIAEPGMIHHLFENITQSAIDRTKHVFKLLHDGHTIYSNAYSGSQWRDIYDVYFAALNVGIVGCTANLAIAKPNSRFELLEPILDFVSTKEFFNYAGQRGLEAIIRPLAAAIQALEAPEEQMFCQNTLTTMCQSIEDEEIKEELLNSVKNWNRLESLNGCVLRFSSDQDLKTVVGATRNQEEAMAVSQSLNQGMTKWIHHQLMSDQEHLLSPTKEDLLAIRANPEQTGHRRTRLTVDTVKEDVKKMIKKNWEMNEKLMQLLKSYDGNKIHFFSQEGKKNKRSHLYWKHFVRHLHPTQSRWHSLLSGVTGFKRR